MRKILHFLMLIYSISVFAQNGALDFSFNQPTGAKNGDVAAVAIQPDGKIVVEVILYL